MLRLLLLLTLVLALSSHSAQAVFEGGPGDGFGAFAAPGIGLNGSLNPPWPGLPLTGGIGDGHSAVASAEYEFTFGFGSSATYAVWQASLFTGAEISGGLTAPLADFDFDGIHNAMEYALGLDPRNGYHGGLPEVAINDLTPYGLPPGGPDYLSLVVTRSPYAVDATLSVEITSDLLFGWTPDDVVMVMNTPSQLISRDEDPVSAHLRRFMRVRVTLP